MHIRHAVVHNLRPFLVELIDYARNGNLVAWDGRGGDNNRVPFPNIQPVRGICHAEQAAHGLALASGRNDADFFIINPAKFFHLHNLLHRDVKVPKFACYLCNVHHAAPLEADHTPMCNRNIRNLLDAVNVGGKCSHNYAALRNLKIVFKGLSDLTFRLRMPGKLRVCGIAHQREHPFCAVMRETRHIDGFSVERRIVHLEISRMDHDACW